MKISAIIQARMTSSRLPGKVVLEVMGRPLLSYLFERLRQCRHLDGIILATTVNKEDDPVVHLAATERIPVFRGQEADVLDRYYQAARQYKVEHIMRITGDCPLIDPQICDQMADVYAKVNVDRIGTAPSFAEGVDCEIFSFRALEKTWYGAKLKSEREHVSLYMRNHPEIFSDVSLINNTDDSKFRITVDNEEDFLVVKAIFENLYGKKRRVFLIEDIKTFLDGHPEIFNLNSHIIRNEGLLISLKNDKIVSNKSNT